MHRLARAHHQAAVGAERRSLDPAAGLRLQLAGDTATTREPVACYVTIAYGPEPVLVTTGIFYEHTHRRTADGWRIVERHERLQWSGPPGGSPAALS